MMVMILPEKPSYDGLAPCEKHGKKKNKQYPRHKRAENGAEKRGTADIQKHRQDKHVEPVEH